tara:strand:- start:25 stop:159 length:135 start_codon:yes stop_codon:yes gene_type:complete
MKHEMQYRGVKYTTDAKKQAKKANKETSSKTKILKKYRGSVVDA